MELFDTEHKESIKGSAENAVFVPLAERMRPKTLDDFAGQKHLIGAGKPIRLMINNNDVFSMIFWGPPGVGKTTLALIIANSVKADFIQISAVSSGVKANCSMTGTPNTSRISTIISCRPSTSAKTIGISWSACRIST